MSSCSNDDSSSMVTPDRDDSSGAGTSTRGGSSNTGGALSLGGSSATDGGDAAGGDGPSVSKNDACASSSRATEALPAVLELVVDTSGSMDWPPGWIPKSPNDSKPPGATKWEITRDALDAAVAALPAETALGASFYPNVEQSDAGCLSTLQAVPIAELGDSGSDARSSWRAALTSVTPVGATPTHGAYRFGLEQLTSARVSGNRFVLLITDGTPTCTLDCACTENNEPVDSEPLIQDAAAAYQDGIRTFVIGSPGSEQAREVLSRLASSGGTAQPGCSDTGPSFCHFDMTTAPDLGAGLARALEQISTSIKSCEYPIPAPPAGQQLDPERVNVLYTPRGKGSETIPRAASASADSCEDGWQYSTDQASVVLCGQACQRAQHENGNVEILFGCQTVVQKPR